MTLLAADNVSKRFGATQALRDVSIEFQPSEIHGLIGPNGSGKSTLLSIVAGTVSPDAGTIWIDGNEYGHIRSPRAARSMGIERMPQELAIVAGASIEGNVVLGAEPSTGGFVRRREARRRAAEALDIVGIQADPTAPAGSLRPSEQRLLMLARVLFRSARLVIVDEPTAGLTEEDAHGVTTALLDVKARGVAVAYVSHELDEVARLADAVTVLRDGEVAARFTGRTGRDELLAELVAGTHLSSSVERTPGEVLLETGALAGGRLRELDLVVRRHEVVGLAGLMGSGRDDVLPAVVGMLPVQGRVTGRGRAVSSPASALRASVGYLNGDRKRAVIRDLRVGLHVSLPVLGRFATGGIVRSRAERPATRAALEQVQVAADSSQPLATLSGGNQQRALLARWLLADVDVLLIDEPTVGVDIAARAALLDELRRFAERGAVVVASSDIDDLVESCDRVLCFRAGRVVAELARSADWQHAINDAIL